jgi:hypothetical protein
MQYYGIISLKSIKKNIIVRLNFAKLTGCPAFAGRQGNLFIKSHFD